MMKKRVLSIFLSILTILLVIPSIHFSAEAATDYSDELRKKGFPETYISSLNKLKQAHPNWNFEVLKVGETFSYSVSQERKSHSQQLIQNYSANNGKGYYCTCSKCYKNGAPLVKEYPNWVSASQKAVEYYLDPRNFLDEQHIFQFESNLYNASQTQAGVESILKGTWMYNANITYKNKQGSTVTYKKNNQTVKYSQAIMEASKYSGLSAYYLASKIVQEVGGSKPTAGGASGTYSGYKGIYNYYNIGANTGAADGLKWAATAPSNSSHVQTSSGVSVNLRSKPTTNSSIVASVPSGTSVKNYEYTAKQSDGYKWVKLTNVSIGGKTYTGYIRSDYFVEKAGKDTYNRPWTNPYLSIYNGAKWIANNFGDQYTGYLQKFNVNPASSYMHSHEYMANIQAASTEAVKTYNAYKNVGALNNAITFSIPVFNNMPGASLAAPKLNPVKINTNGSFTLSWNSVSNADKYELYIKQTDGSYKLMKTTTATSFTTAVATIGRTYSYKIKAVNSKYNISSAFSNIESAIYDNKLSKPNMNNVVINADCSFKLSWSAVSGADKYEIYLLNANGTAYNLMKTTTSTSFTTAVATYGRKYSYKVRAVNSKNKVYSDFSNIVSATNTKLAVPTFNAVKVNPDCSFNLSWSAVYGADKYEIYLLGSNGKYNLMKTTTT
ncbi:MAG: SH3 domain-containing protein, partial [Eubacterium sp.]|nr:SH3 domain-containing protein [Eubacterium sp.]